MERRAFGAGWLHNTEHPFAYGLNRLLRGRMDRIAGLMESFASRLSSFLINVLFHIRVFLGDGTKPVLLLLIIWFFFFSCYCFFGNNLFIFLSILPWKVCLGFLILLG